MVFDGRSYSTSLGLVPPVAHHPESQVLGVVPARRLEASYQTARYANRLLGVQSYPRNLRRRSSAAENGGAVRDTTGVGIAQFKIAGYSPAVSSSRLTAEITYVAWATEDVLIRHELYTVDSGGTATLRATIDQEGGLSLEQAGALSGRGTQEPDIYGGAARTRGFLENRYEKALVSWAAGEDVGNGNIEFVLIKAFASNASSSGRVSTYVPLVVALWHEIEDSSE